MQPRDYRRIDAADCRRRLNRADAGCAMFSSRLDLVRWFSLVLSRLHLANPSSSTRSGDGGEQAEGRRGKTWTEGGRATAGETEGGRRLLVARRGALVTPIYTPRWSVSPYRPAGRESTRRESVDSEPLRWRRHRRRRYHHPPTRPMILPPPAQSSSSRSWSPPLPHRRRRLVTPSPTKIDVSSRRNRYHSTSTRR